MSKVGAAMGKFAGAMGKCGVSTAEAAALFQQIAAAAPSLESMMAEPVDETPEVEQPQPEKHADFLNTKRSIRVDDGD
jgi:hypothetical protein